MRPVMLAVDPVTVPEYTQRLSHWEQLTAVNWVVVTPPNTMVWKVSAM